MSGQLRRTVRYGALSEWLLSCPPDEVTASLAEIEDLLGFELPPKAWSDPNWWRSAPRNTWARSWLLVHRAATLDVAEARVTFIPRQYSPALSYAAAAEQRVKYLGTARDRLAKDSRLWEEDVKAGFWEPHTIYVLHQSWEPLYKVGLTNGRTDRRIREQTAKGRASLVSTVVVPNKWDAVLVEGRVLELTEHARKYADPYTSLNGQTEHWEDSVAPPELSPIVAELAADEALTFWGSSLDRHGSRITSDSSTHHE